MTAAAPRAARDAAWVTAAMVLGRGLAFVTSIAASHLLSVDALASYLVMVSGMLILIPVADLGFVQLTGRTAARTLDAPLYGLSRYAAELRIPWWIALTIGALAVSALTAVPVEVALTAVAGAIGQTLLDMLAAESFARRRFRRGAALQVAPAITGVLATFAVLSWRPEAQVAFMVFAASRVIPGVLALLWQRPPRERSPLLNIRAAIPFAATLFVITAYTRSDVLILAHFFRAGPAVAQYAVAYTILNAMQILPGAMGAALFPRIAGNDAASAGKEQLALTASVISIGIAIPVAAVAVMLPGVVLAPFAVGVRAHAADVAPLYFAIVPIALSQLLAPSLQGMDRERSLLVIIVVVALVNIVGNWLAIPRWGVPGAIGATIFAETLMALLAGGLMLSSIPPLGVLASILLALSAGPAAAFGLVGATEAALIALASLAGLWLVNAYGLRSRIVAVVRSPAA